MSSTTKPSSNRSAQASTPQETQSFAQNLPRRPTRRKIERTKSVFPRNPPSPPQKRIKSDAHHQDIDLEETSEVKNGESIAALRRMVLGKVDYEASQTSPRKYLAIDCEMVGVGINGDESSLARVSIVTYTGAVVLDVFVRQRERVVDYRTRWSGVRSADLTGSAKPFKEVQQMVADLIKDRILVGHAIHNDLKALLLSHPSPQIRDTQSLAYKHGIVKSRRPALRVLAKQELGIVIQDGEHSSVTDARATMALFRLYRKQWQSNFRPHTLARLQAKNVVDSDCAAKVATHSRTPPSMMSGKKRGRSESFPSDEEDVDEGLTHSSRPRIHSPPPSPSHTRSPSQHILVSPKRHGRSESRPSTGLKGQAGISSGISTVVRRSGGVKQVRSEGTHTGKNFTGDVVMRNSKGRGEVREKWWKSLG